MIKQLSMKQQIHHTKKNAFKKQTDEIWLSQRNPTLDCQCSVVCKHMQPDAKV